VFPLFGRTFFTNLGLGPGSALLAGISFLLMPVFWVRSSRISIGTVAD
jgi:DHA1 family multidrug resistance protein-like MFS transporter